jgi:hypothetical protein
MSHAPSADYSDQPFYLQYPAAVATIITIVIAGVFIYLVGASYHPPGAGQGSHGAAPGKSGAPATSAAPAAPPKH